MTAPIIIVGPVNDMRILGAAVVCAARLNALPGERLGQFLEWMNTRNAHELDQELHFFIEGALYGHGEPQQPVSEVLSRLEEVVEKMMPPTRQGRSVRTFVLRRVRRPQQFPLAIEG